MELLSLILVVVCALGVVVLWTRGVFARDLTQALKRVQHQEQALQEKAEILERRIRELERDYQAKLKRAEGEADQLLTEAKSQAMNIRTAAIEEAKHRARQLLLEAEQERGRLRAEVAKELDGHAIDRACESLGRLLSDAQLAALHTTLVQELLAALPEIDPKTLQGEGARLVIVAGRPLADGELGQVTAWARAARGTSVPVEVKSDEKLVAGCVVRLGAVIVDNSFANRLRSALHP